MIVEPPVSDNASSLSEGVRSDIEQILATIVRTSIDKEAAGELTEQDIEEKIVVSVQQFFGNNATPNDQATPVIPWWIWVVGGILVIVIVLLVVTLLFAKKRKENEEELELMELQQRELFVDDINEEKETESTVRRKQLEKMAKEKPEELCEIIKKLDN
ncbi:Flagellar M-ring protein OS=Ureibacillus acetophenoni OX=614649 GN=SAMN05877842_101468 PE=3 SV=1 [Ureibacillus acetophenoni]